MFSVSISALSRASMSELNYLKIFFSILTDSALQTSSQLLSISGSPPLLIDSQKYWQSSMNIVGEQGFPLKVFFLMSLVTFPLSSVMSSKNLGLIYESLTFDISWSFFSSSTGRISMKQSLSLKKLISSFLMLFFLVTKSEVPFCSLSAFSRYY